MRRYRLTAAVCFWLCLTAAGPCLASDKAMTQYATIEALMAGEYTGFVSIGEVLGQGACGLGTVDALDGELICLDAACYRIAVDGVAHALGPGELSPFAVIAPFASETTLTLGRTDDLAAVEKALTKALPSANLFAVARLSGTFAKVTTRSVPRQKPPYPTLTEAVKLQRTFDFTNVTGTVIAVYQPAAAAGLGVAGWHMHFLTADRKSGGHVLGLSLDGVKAELESYSRFHLNLPRTPGFLNRDLSASGGRGAIEAVERQGAGK